MSTAAPPDSASPPPSSGTDATSPPAPAQRRANLAADLRRLPNLVSLARIVMLVIAVTFWFSGWPLTALALGIIAGTTDYLDGYLARRLNQVTYLGAILDQFSDNLFEFSLLIMLATSDVEGVIPMWIILIYLVREFWVMTIRRFLAAHQVQIHSNFVGKLKTNFISWSFVPWFAYVAGVYPPANTFFVVMNWTGVGGGLMFSLWSAADYSRQFFKAYDTLWVD
jgi:CDP-diacylglycerol--glycerol-3-phosphate 3-phosphatidyltransferase